jgi:hypothetical protein
MTKKNRKTLRSGLRQRPAGKETVDRRSAALNTYDQAVGCLAHIRTLAGLLEAAGTRKDEPLEAALVSVTGSLILREADHLHAVVKRSLPRDLG